MTHLKKQTDTRTIVLMFVFIYTISYITRINYGAIISEIEQATHISRSLLSLALTGSFITYGVGQIISGLFGDRFSTKKLISLGLFITAAMNLIMPLCSTPYQMLVVWCINGFAQALLWPPIVKTMAFFLSQEEYGKNMVKVSWGSALGTMLVYLLSPILIASFGWKAVFVGAALCGTAMVLVWTRFGYDVKPSPKQTRNGVSAASHALFTPVMICIMIAIVFHGMIRDSVMTWMPSYISETYQISNSAAILSGVILPGFSILCYRITEYVHRKALSNLLVCAGSIFMLSTLAAGVLYLFPGGSAAMAILLMALINGCTHGINFLFISLLPTYFKKYGNISTVSGVLNACTYIGSALSTYGIALVSEQFGWGASACIWMFLSIGGAALCFANAFGWNREMQNIV